MIVDTSALLAILRDESDAPEYVRAIQRFPVHRISAGTLLEASIAIDSRRNPIASRGLDALLRTAAVVVEPITAEQITLARGAYQHFAKGSSHPAGLNFGDCLAYALAKALNEPLLYKGNGFSHTDVRSALDMHAG